MPSFYDQFVLRAERWPDNIAVEIQRHNEVERHSYATLRRMAESIGRWLAERELPPAARVAILASNDPLWVASYLGIIAAGCTVVPLDTALNAGQVAKLLRDSGSSLLFCDRKQLALAQKSLDDLDVGIVLIDSESNDTSETEARSQGEQLPEHVIAEF